MGFFDWLSALWLVLVGDEAAIQPANPPYGEAETQIQPAKPPIG